jgi:hypothetical protein
VRVPSWESHRKVRTRTKRCRVFSSEEFHRNCETVSLSIVLRQQGTTIQYRAAQSSKVRDVSTLQLLQYLLYWNWSFATYSAEQNLSRQQRLQYWIYRDSITAAASPICLGNSVAVLDLQRQSRQQLQASEDPFTGLSTAFAAFPVLDLQRQYSRQQQQ